MDQEDLDRVIPLLEALGAGLHQGISIIDRSLKVVWINSYLEQKGFHLNQIKGTFYQKCFNDQDGLDIEDPSYKAFTTGKVVAEVKAGADGKLYKMLSIPLQEKGRVFYTIEFSKPIEEYENEELEKLRRFIVERELKMVELKQQVEGLEGGY